MDKNKFLEEYLELEERLRDTYHVDSVYGTKWLGDPFLRQFENDFDMFRQVRNVLSHNKAKKGAEYICVNDAMEERMAYVSQHIFEHVGAVCWSYEQIYSCRLGESVLQAIRVMHEKDYTHVPIMDGTNRVVGVFSENTLLKMFAKDGSCQINPGTTFLEIKKYLSNYNDDDALFTIVKPDTPLSECVNMLTDSMRRHKRLDLLLVTPSGDDSSPLMGLTTIWDLAGN